MVWCLLRGQQPDSGPLHSPMVFWHPLAARLPRSWNQGATHRCIGFTMLHRRSQRTESRHLRFHGFFHKANLCKSLFSAEFWTSPLRSFECWLNRHNPQKATFCIISSYFIIFHIFWWWCPMLFGKIYRDIWRKPMPRAQVPDSLPPGSSLSRQCWAACGGDAQDGGEDLVSTTSAVGWVGGLY